MTDKDEKPGGWTYLSESYYGAFPEGHDPRAFVPDLEMSTRDEREAHLRAEEAWDRGERTRYPAGAFGVGAVFEKPRVWDPTMASFRIRPDPNVATQDPP